MEQLLHVSMGIGDEFIFVFGSCLQLQLEVTGDDYKWMLYAKNKEFIISYDII